MPDLITALLLLTIYLSLGLSCALQRQRRGPVTLGAFVLLIVAWPVAVFLDD